MVFFLISKTTSQSKPRFSSIFCAIKHKKTH